jgi:hypothetical protein
LTRSKFPKPKDHSGSGRSQGHRQPAHPGAGKDIHLYFAKAGMVSRTAPNGQLKAIEIDDSNDAALALTWEKGIRGILFQRREKPHDVELKTVSGVVEESLFEDGRKAGIHQALLSQLTDIFTWDVDLEKKYLVTLQDPTKRSRGQDTKKRLKSWPQVGQCHLK